MPDVNVGRLAWFDWFFVQCLLGAFGAAMVKLLQFTILIRTEGVHYLLDELAYLVKAKVIGRVKGQGGGCDFATRARAGLVACCLRLCRPVWWWN